MSKRGRKPSEGSRKATRGKPSERNDVIRSVNFENCEFNFALTLEIRSPGIIGKEKSAVLSIFLWGEIASWSLSVSDRGPSLWPNTSQPGRNPDPDKESGFDNQSHNRSISF